MPVARSEFSIARNEAVTTVVDGGARYGMHPSWAGFAGELRYLAFEPDEEEARRLRRRQQHSGFEVVEQALARTAGVRDLYLTKHRGYSSLLEVDPESEWFKRYRPGESELESVIRVRTCSVDEFADDRGVTVDFLKVDTEGTELEVLEGASRQLESNLLGLRVNVNFQACYKNQALFPEIHNFLAARRFFILNLDYCGRGVPRNSFFRNADPLSCDPARYGTLIGTDGVWLADFDRVRERCESDAERLSWSALKYAYFCMLNHAPDVAIDVLGDFTTRGPHRFGEHVRQSELYRGLRRACAEFLGRWRAFPDRQWECAQEAFLTIFEVELPGGARYWEFLQSL